MTDHQMLDRLLTLQFIVAWAGEEEARPARLPWWRTNWIDEYGGYDLLSRMMPRTAEWAQFELAREAARRVDQQELQKQAKAASIRSIFNLGPEMDAKLDERLFELKTAMVDPFETLPGLSPLRDGWNEAVLEDAAGAGGEARNFVREPFGKRLQGDAPEDPVELVYTLMRGLLPLEAAPYPRPYVELS